MQHLPYRLPASLLTPKTLTNAAEDPRRHRCTGASVKRDGIAGLAGLIKRR